MNQPATFVTLDADVSFGGRGGAGGGPVRLIRSGSPDDVTWMSAGCQVRLSVSLSVSLSVPAVELKLFDVYQSWPRCRGAGYGGRGANCPPFTSRGLLI